MTSMPTNGMPSWGGGLPPQAPTSSRQHHASHAHHRANSADIIDASTSANLTSSKPSSSSQRRHKSRSGRSGRTRSSSDGVKMMKEQYHQQLQHQQMQQQYYGGYPNYNYYQMQYPNQIPPPPPPGYGFHPPPQSQAPPPPPPLPPTTSPPSMPINQQIMMNRQQLPPFPMDHRAQNQRRMRGVSFDAASFPFQSIDANLSSSHGVPPSTRSAANTTTTSSGAFSAMNELYSVIGPTSGGGGGAGGGGGGSNRGGVGPRRSSHRRTQSDSVVVPREQPTLPLPSLPESRSVVGGERGVPTLMRTNSCGSQGSHQSFLARHLNNYGPLPNSNAGGGGMGMHPMGNYPDFIPEETAALLAQQHHSNNSNMGAGGKTKMHMRQNSVNMYMKPFTGEKQPKVCRDVIFVVLFILQLAIMIVLGLKFGPEAVVATSSNGPGEGLDDDAAMIMEDSDDLLLLDYRNILKIAITCGAFAIVVSALTLAFMMAMSRRLVYVALVLSIGVSFAWGTIGIGISPKSFVPITGIITLMLTVGYMFVVWDRIPFASANLTTALTGVRDNLSLVGVAFLFQFLTLIFSIFYSFTFVGLHNVTHNGELAEISDRSMIGLNVLLWVSFYWTFQVLRHVVIVTVAGTIGSWWFGQPSALCETFATATVFNFGSICYGSLFVGVVQFLRQITEGLRPNRDGSAMMCLYECSLFFQEKLIGCVDNLADSFTPWAFTYIGLYHYGLKEAGHRANELFVRRGWSRIVTDDLISSVLAMVSLVIGGLSGSFAVILQALDGHGLTNFGHPVLVSFLIGFMVGIVLSAVLFQIIDSSVCAVIVCFAGSPVEFHRNHPALSHEMRNAWKEVWPGSLDIDNVGVGLGLA